MGEGSLLQGKESFQEATLQAKKEQRCFPSASFALGFEAKKPCQMMLANMHSDGQGSLPGEVGLQLNPEGQTEGRSRGVYMGEMESYKAKQAASVLEGQ